MLMLVVMMLAIIMLIKMVLLIRHVLLLLLDLPCPLSISFCHAPPRSHCF